MMKKTRTARKVLVLSLFQLSGRGLENFTNAVMKKDTLQGNPTFIVDGCLSSLLVHVVCDGRESADHSKMKCHQPFCFFNVTCLILLNICSVCLIVSLHVSFSMLKIGLKITVIQVEAMTIQSHYAA